MMLRILMLLVTFVVVALGCFYWVAHLDLDIERYQTERPRM